MQVFISSIGNMSRYMISYLRIKLDPTLSYEESIWIFASCTMCQGLSACIGGILLKKFGPRKTALLGTLIFWCVLITWFTSVMGIWLTYFTIKHSFAMTVFTYGAIVGVGLGWFPDKEGLVSGLIVAGIGGGAVIFDPIQTAYLNPKNKIPDQQGHGKDRQSDILDNVPTCILILGLCYTGIQLIGSLLLVNPRMGIDKFSEQTYLTEETMLTSNGQHNTSKPYRTVKDPITAEGNLKKQTDSIEKTECTDFPTDHTQQQGKEHLRTSAFRKWTLNCSTSIQTTVGLQKKQCQRYIEDWDNSSINDKNEGNKREYTPREVLRNKFLYILWFINLLNGQGITFISTLYKVAIVGSLAAACNGGGRLLWGILSDKYSVRTSLILSSGLICILMLTFNVTSLVSRELYVVYVCLLFLSLSGNSVLLPTATAKAFGKEHYGVNFGIIYTACIITSPLSAVLTSNLKNRIGWDGMFYMIAAFSFINSKFESNCKSNDALSCGELSYLKCIIEQIVFILTIFCVFKIYDVLLPHFYFYNHIRFKVTYYTLLFNSIPVIVHTQAEYKNLQTVAQYFRNLIDNIFCLKYHFVLRVFKTLRSFELQLSQKLLKYDEKRFLPIFSRKEYKLIREKDENNVL
ncbi:hypothetical protein KUTeg_011476 [Tegillarca granosa]|uniref:Uncharacterized protein n=1 Tax=Tegillarca granosa TaxID=220873 RepID=A0ABQ9F461_TEGGR|nr:hypothetical protein KUTeg_011476 [Tegillarca granosa]